MEIESSKIDKTYQNSQIESKQQNTTQYKTRKQSFKLSSRKDTLKSLSNNLYKNTYKKCKDHNNQQDNISILHSQQIIKKIISFPDKQGFPLIKKYTINYLISLLDKNKIQSIDKVYRVKQQGFNLLQFVRFFLNAIQHNQTQTLYLTICLVDFFKSISEVNGFTQKIKFIHLTDYICNNILTENGEKNLLNNQNDNKIETKLIPGHKSINPKYQIKQYITNPPIITGNKEEIIYKVSLNNAKIDKNKHDSVVMNCCFSQTYNKIFSLDALSDSICIYDPNCKLERKLKPTTSKAKKDAVILSFAYSKRQQRVGAVMKDFTICFWDFSDNFQFQKVISTASFCVQYQSNIWYLQYFQNWITSDKSGIITIWNIENSIPQRKIQCKFKGKINDVSQIPCLNIIAVAQQFRSHRGNLNKKQIQQAKIILYNYFKGQEVAQISTQPQMRIPHTLQYSQTYQVLLSAGFEKKINIFQINHKYLDTSLIGQLSGHQSLITNFILIKNTPMVVSSDDKGKVKIWDLRNYKCIQTLDFQDKTIISRLLDMVQIGKLGVLGSRVNFLEYDEKIQITKKYQTKQRNYPVSLSFNYQKNKLLILTKNDIRLYNMRNGSVDKVFCQYHSKDQQIIVFKYYELMKKIAIGNQKGQIKLFNILSIGKTDANGTSILGQQRLQGFQNGLVSHIQYDQQNKLFLTCGQNGTINIERMLQNVNMPEENIKNKPSQQNKIKYQQEIQKQSKEPNQKQWVVIRQMKGNFNNKDITTLAFSVYHGFIAIGSTCSDIYVWDYEFAQILFHITLPNELQPSAMTFLNGFSVLVIAAGSGQIFFVKLQRNTQIQIKNGNPCLLLYFNINNINSQQETKHEYITQILPDITLQGVQSQNTQTKQKLEFSNLYFSSSSGRITILYLTDFLSVLNIFPHRKTIPTYNPQRQLKQQFLIQLKKDKCIRYDITQSLIQEYSTKKFPYVFKNLKAHKGMINSMKILEFDKHYLATCGQNDQRIKIWNEEQLICDTNINLPLPYKWEFTFQEQKKTRDKIMFSLKIIQSIFKKFGTDISTGQSKLLKLQKFFRSLDTSKKQNQDQSNFITQINSYSYQQNENKQIYLFHKQFTKKDLHYDEIKKYNFSQIGGPSLRELDFKKKLQQMQKQWQISKMKEQEQKSQLLIKIQNRAQKNDQKQQVMNFLQDRHALRRKKLSKQEELFPFVKRLAEQLNKVEQIKSNTNNLSNFVSSKILNLTHQNLNSSISDFKTFIPSYIRNNNRQHNNKNSIIISQSGQKRKTNLQNNNSCFALRKHVIASMNKSKKQPSPKFQEYYKQKFHTNTSTNTPFQSLRSPTMSNCISMNSSFIEQRHDNIKSYPLAIKPKLQNKQNDHLLTLQNGNKDKQKQKNFCSSFSSKSTFQTNQHIQKQKHISFQSIIKDMNKKILVSKQSRNSVRKNIIQHDQQSLFAKTFRDQEIDMKRKGIKTQMSWFKK